MSTAEASATVPPDRIDFIYEDYARRVLLSLFK
jgi:hypothetical protein